MENQSCADLSAYGNQGGHFGDEKPQPPLEQSKRVPVERLQKVAAVGREDAAINHALASSGNYCRVAVALQLVAHQQAGQTRDAQHRMRSERVHHRLVHLGAVVSGVGNDVQVVPQCLRVPGSTLFGRMAENDVDGGRWWFDISSRAPPDEKNRQTVASSVHQGHHAQELLALMQNNANSRFVLADNVPDVHSVTVGVRDARLIDVDDLKRSKTRITQERRINVA